METIDPAFKQKIEKFGAGNWQECFHCGNCTAVCPLTDEDSLFPRKGIRQIQMGLTRKIEKNLDPWLCYYCGECSETCPRNANPGELMMTLRRYLTSVYDWTGLSKLFYTNKKWELISILILSVLILLSFFLFLPLSPLVKANPQGFINSEGGVMINSLVNGTSNEQFVHIIETGDLIMALVVSVLLISNILRMWYKVILSDASSRVPFLAYFTEAWRLITNFVAQPRFSKCDNKKYWGGHFLMMSGYTIMFILIVGFLPRFQIEQVVPWYNWQRILGYYATFGILFFLISVTVQRFRKQKINLKFSHLSDWMFIILLFLTTVTGILVHLFRINGQPVATYYTYIVHLAILVPMIVIEVPFSKWSHLAYRPFAVYFAALRARAVAVDAIKPEFVTA